LTRQPLVLAALLALLLVAPPPAVAQRAAQSADTAAFASLIGTWDASGSGFSTRLSYYWSVPGRVLEARNVVRDTAGEVLANYVGAYLLDPVTQRWEFYISGSDGELHRGRARWTGGLLWHEATIAGGRTPGYASVVRVTADTMRYFARYTLGPADSALLALSPLVYRRLRPSAPPAEAMQRSQDSVVAIRPLPDVPLLDGRVEAAYGAPTLRLSTAAGAVLVWVAQHGDFVLSLDRDGSGGTRPGDGDRQWYLRRVLDSSVVSDAVRGAWDAPGVTPVSLGAVRKGQGGGRLHLHGQRVVDRVAARANGDPTERRQGRHRVPCVQRSTAWLVELAGGAGGARSRYTFPVRSAKNPSAKFNATSGRT
jgi:hypothetical protein